MADKDIKIIQEQASGAPKESVVVPTANSTLGFDASKDPVAIPAVTQPEAEAGTSTELRSWSPERVKQSIVALTPEPDFPTPSNSLTLIADASDVVTGYGLTTIPEDWKSGQTTLKGLSIGQGVTSIGDYAFYNCSGFTGSLTIPNSVTSIGSDAFYSCSGFTGSLTIGNSVTTIGSDAFYSCSGFTGSLTIGNSVTTIGGNAFRSCSSFTGSLTIPNSVTLIGDYAFYSCSGFTGSLTIPNSVTSIGDNAFRSCSSFTGSLTIPNSVTSIGSSAFNSCSGFTGSLTIGSSVTTIGSNAFRDCSAITNVQCRVTKTIIDAATNAFLGSGITTINALAADGTWTAGAGQTIAGKSGITVIKDLV